MTGTDRGQTTLDFAFGVSVFLLTAIFVLTFVPGMLQPFEQSTQEEITAANRIATDLAEETLASPDRPYVLDRECTIIFFESREDGNAPAGDDALNVDGDGAFTSPFGTGTYAGTCNFQDVPFDERLALPSGSGAPLNVRVKLVSDLTTVAADDPDGGNGGDDDAVETLCLDANSHNRIIEGHTPFTGGYCSIDNSPYDDVLLEIGPAPPSGSGSVVVARRFVRVEGGFADGTSDATLVVEVW